MTKRTMQRRRAREAVRAAAVSPERRREIDAEMAEFSKLFRPLENGKQRAFLMAYVRTLGIRSAMRLSGVERQDHYFWLKTDERYAELFDQAQEMLADMFEEEVLRRAWQGHDVPITYRGDIKNWYKSYSDQLVMFMLRALRPEKYHRLAHDGYPSGPTGFDIRILGPGETLADAEKRPEPSAISIPAPDGGEEEKK
jgi:hypothetical protein